ncbi:MAG: DinB family protein [Candidatus Limnocylindria bacterium]
MIKDHNARNRAARERLDALLARLGERDVVLDGGWTAAALLAHLAFWDRIAMTRLEKYLRDRETPAFASDTITEYTNAAGLRQWKDTPVRVAAAQARDAAAAVDRLVETLPADALAALKALGRPFVIDRSLHRKEHIDQIERVLR